MEWQRQNEASIHRTAQLDRKFIPLSSLLFSLVPRHLKNRGLGTRLSTVKLSTTNADRLQHRWTRQLLHGSALLPRPSTLKLTSLLFCRKHLSASRSTFGDASRFALSPRFPPSLKLLHSQVSVVECSARMKSASTEPLDISQSRGGGGGGA